MKNWLITICCCLLFIVTGCNSDVEFQPVSKDKQAELESFIREYRNDLAIAYNQFNFSLVESYFVPNSHYYHYQRQTIGKNSSQRIKEQIEDISVSDIKQDEQNDYHLSVTETVKIIDPVKGESVETIDISYLVMVYRDELKVIDAREQPKNQ